MSKRDIINIFMDLYNCVQHRLVAVEPKSTDLPYPRQSSNQQPNYHPSDWQDDITNSHHHDPNYH